MPFLTCFFFLFQVYRGVETRCQVKDLEPGADYLVRVGAVRLCGEDRPAVDGAFSLPASLSTPPIHHENSTPTHAPRHNNQQVTVLKNCFSF